MRRMNKNNINDDSYDKLSKAYGSISDENQQIRRIITDWGDNSGKTADTGIKNQQIERNSINNWRNAPHSKNSQICSKASEK